MTILKYFKRNRIVLNILIVTQKLKILTFDFTILNKTVVIALFKCRLFMIHPVCK